MVDDPNRSLISRYKGLYDTGLTLPDPQGLAELFDFIRPKADEPDRCRFEHHVIRDSESFSSFVDRIPKTVGNRRPNDDELLRCPDIDFEQHMVLAITSHDANRFIDVEIQGVEQSPEMLRVLCHCSEPGPLTQKVISFGQYCAVVVRRIEGEVVFVNL